MKSANWSAHSFARPLATPSFISQMQQQQTFTRKAKNFSISINPQILFHKQTIILKALFALKTFQIKPKRTQPWHVNPNGQKILDENKEYIYQKRKTNEEQQVEVSTEAHWLFASRAKRVEASFGYIVRPVRCAHLPEASAYVFVCVCSSTSCTCAMCWWCANWTSPKEHTVHDRCQSIHVARGSALWWLGVSVPEHVYIVFFTNDTDDGLRNEMSEHMPKFNGLLGLEMSMDLFIRINVMNFQINRSCRATCDMFTVY